MEPKILLIDVETLAGTGFFWGHKWDTNITKIVEYMNIISFSAKWLGGKQVTKCLRDYRGYRPYSRNDKELVKDIWKLLDEADVVVGQNSKQYDEKVINSRFMFYGLTPPSPYKSIDTKLESRKYLNLPSYSLNDIADYFKLGRKIEHEGWDLWEKCFRGDKKSFTKMKRYNANDVILLEKVYLKLRPFMKNLNIGIYHEGIICPRCQSSHIQYRGYAVNKTTKYRRGQCQNCAGWFRMTENLQIIKPLVSI